MNSLIKAIEKNTAQRKKIKNLIDSEINLSVNNELDAEYTAILSVQNSDTNRLIDEGAIIEGDGSIWGYIKKGTLEKFLNGENEYLDNLPDGYSGYVNIGHFDHSIFPFPVGEWKKNDMTLVDIGDDRHGIDMNNSVIDRESVFIKELERLGIDVSESIEATFHLDYEATEDFGFPVFDEIHIYGFAIVGDGKNVGSNGLQLKGDNKMLTDKENLTAETVDVEVALEEGTDAVVEDTKEDEITVDVEVSEEAKTDEVSEETLNADVEGEADTEDATDDAADDEAKVEEDGESADLAVDEDEGEEADTLNEAFEVVETLKAQVEALNKSVEELTKANEALKKSNRRLNNKLATEKEAKEQFLASTKDLVIELLPNEKESKETDVEFAVDTDYFNGDGIKE